MSEFTCTRCGETASGQTYGADVRDTWCMGCWYAHQDARATSAVSSDDLRELIDEADMETYVKLPDRPTVADLKAAAKNLSERLDDEYGRIDSEIEDLQSELREMENLCRRTEEVWDTLKTVPDWAVVEQDAHSQGETLAV